MTGKGVSRIHIFVFKYNIVHLVSYTLFSKPKLQKKYSPTKIQKKGSHLVNGLCSTSEEFFQTPKQGEGTHTMARKHGISFLMKLILKKVQYRAKKKKKLTNKQARINRQQTRKNNK